MCRAPPYIRSFISSLISSLRIKYHYPKIYASVISTITDSQAACWAIALPADSLLGLHPHHASRRNSDRACNSAGLAFASPSAHEAEVVREEYVGVVPAVDGVWLSTVRK
jgi:hypothetical protein